MASQAPPAPQGQAPNGSPQALNQIVIEYLSKKGYSKTEAMLRQESKHTDADGRPILSKVEDHPQTMYEKAYTHLKRWIDNSLDIYKPELRRILFPVFVHSYLQLIHSGFQVAGKQFFTDHAPEHAATFSYDMQQMSVLSLPQHVDDNKCAQLYLENKYCVTLSRITYNLLTHFLEETQDAGGKIVLKFLNLNVDFRIISGRPTMFSASRVDDGGMPEGEGIPGHSFGRLATGENLPGVKLGSMPMDKEFIADVEEELKEQDVRLREAIRSEELGVSTSVAGSLIDEFQKIKREESEDSPMRDVLPLPPYKVADIEREVRLVRESRDKVKLNGLSSPALPSCCMYTFHNTNDNMICIDFSEDVSLAAVGFEGSFIQIFSLKGGTLESVIPSENRVRNKKSRKLIGHSGPVFGVSISPDNKYLLSCSEDKSARLWSLETYTCLVVYKGHDSVVWDVTFGPFGHYFVTGSHDHTARLWSCDHIYPLRIFAGHLNDVCKIIFHPNGAYVFTGSDDKTIRMWDISTGNSVRLFTGHTAPVTRLAVSPDGKWLASAGEDWVINLWDILSGKRIKSMKGHGKTSITGLSFSMEGSVLVSCGLDMTVRCWDVAYGTGTSVADVEGVNGTSGVAGAADNAAKPDAIPGQTGKQRKGGNDVIATPDHMQVLYTKKSPVKKVMFTRKNLVVAGSAYLPGPI